MKVLVTRPEPQASQWSAALIQAGMDAMPLPLIEIQGPADPNAVTQCWAQLAQMRLIMFVSPASAKWFFQLRPSGAPWPADTLAAAPGPGTAQAVQEAGAASGLQIAAVIHPHEDAPQFDSEALWPLLSGMAWRNQHVTIISGGDALQSKGRAWLTEQLRAAGATVGAILTYQRLPACWTADQSSTARTALAHPDEHVWLFSSSESIDHLQQRFPTTQDWSGVRALVTHPKIGQRAHNAGFRQVIDTHPTLDSVVHTLRNLPCSQGQP